MKARAASRISRRLGSLACSASEAMRTHLYPAIRILDLFACQRVATRERSSASSHERQRTGVGGGNTVHEPATSVVNNVVNELRYLVHI